jgi:hypothetical protein
MPDKIWNKVTTFHSPDKKGVHANSELDLEDFANIIQQNYGLKDLNKCDFPEDDDWDSDELYHFQIVNKKLFTAFVLKWS